MKIIIRIDSDDQRKLEMINKGAQGEIFTVPQGEEIKIFVINDKGDVEELK